MNKPSLTNGFTLIEMLVVILLIAIIMGGTTTFYINLSNQELHATQRVRAQRTAVAILDRVSRDLERSLLLAPSEETETDLFPWIFLAEQGSGNLGASRLKFATTSHLSRASKSHESDTTLVAYFLNESTTGLYQLLRWEAPRLPERLDSSFPEPNDDGVLVLAENISDFGVRFLDRTNGWQDQWVANPNESMNLPIAAEIQISLQEQENDSDNMNPEPNRVYSRKVLIPMTTLNFAALADPAVRQEMNDELAENAEDSGTGKEDSDNSSCRTVAQCVNLSAIPEWTHAHIMANPSACIDKPPVGPFPNEYLKAECR